MRNLVSRDHRGFSSLLYKKRKMLKKKNSHVTSRIRRRGFLMTSRTLLVRDGAAAAFRSRSFTKHVASSGRPLGVVVFDFAPFPPLSFERLEIFSVRANSVASFRASSSVRRAPYVELSVCAPSYRENENLGARSWRPEAEQNEEADWRQVINSNLAHSSRQARA